MTRQNPGENPLGDLRERLNGELERKTLDSENPFLTRKGKEVHRRIKDLLKILASGGDYYFKLPKKRDKIYVETELYLSHGADDFEGGLCTILKVEQKDGRVFVTVKERPGWSYDYAYLLEKQGKLKKKYGNRKGRASPDMRYESNCWAAPGDLVNGKVIDYYIP